MNIDVNGLMRQDRKYTGAMLGNQFLKKMAISILTITSLLVCESAMSLDADSIDLEDVSREIVSLKVDGSQIEFSARSASISYAGRRIAYVSADPQIVNDGNLLEDVYLRDLERDTTFLISYGKEEAADRPSYEPSLSLYGEHVAYTSLATNLVCPKCDRNDRMDVYLFDFNRMTNRRISQALKDETDGRSHQPSVSRDGNRIAFTSLATNLIANDSNQRSDIFVWDRYKGIKRVSLSTDGNQLALDSHSPQISGDGRYVVFVTGSGSSHVFMHEIDSNTTFRVSEESALTEVGRNREPSISETGDYIAWVSDGYWGKDAVGNVPDRVFVRDMVGPTLCGLTGCIGFHQMTWQLNDEPGEQREPQIYADPGEFNLIVPRLPSIGVAYTSTSKEGRRDVVVDQDGLKHDHIFTVSVGEFGEAANGNSRHPTAYGGHFGWFIAFETDANNLIYDDNDARDIVFAKIKGR